MNRELDISFMRRVYRMSVGVWLLSLLLCWGMHSLDAAIGITVGLAISVGSLMILQRVVTTVFTPDNAVADKRPVRRLLAVAFLKYGIIGAILWACLSWEIADPKGIAVGIGIPYAVIILKALGMAISFGPEVDRTRR